MSAQVHFVSADGATYADLEAAPAGYTVDLIGGRLIHWELNRVVTVPELAGWRKEPMPDMPDDHRFTGVPDWLGEILSPTTCDYELNEKVPLHARYSVPFLWLIDPDAPWLAPHVLEGESYREAAWFGPGEPIQTPPFEAVAFTLFN